MREINATTFLKDISNHGMTVRLDNGLYRHLVFRTPAPNSWNMWFELVTWPGSLTINGDMGTWSFARVEDMFTFFRSAELRINAQYWAEKITAESRFGGPHKQFIPEVFKANVISSLDGYGLSAQHQEEVVKALRDDAFHDEDEAYMRRAVAEFKHEGFKFSDSWEIDGSGYTGHYLWCLHAIVWGIQQYDSANAKPVPAEIPAGGKT